MIERHVISFSLSPTRHVTIRYCFSHERSGGVEYQASFLQNKSIPDGCGWGPKAGRMQTRAEALKSASATRDSRFGDNAIR